jgi:chromosome segregation protein
MRLKRLVLQGYKTFATKTEFVFDEGFTAIVGPNGSGKSNIADAVRWVLGEQSYSMLRGKRTTDMIFAGSQSRPRAGMAQAILTLDNSDGWLPIDYTEVEIGRRAHRSGENEYILNGQKVRLKDITDLLSTSGLSQRTYTMIGQGLVDQALSLRAEERRALFEEAAGINHYKTRRAETLRRLQETQRNLERVHDILAEIRPRLNSLKRQATRARNYEQLTADLQNLLRLWYGYKWEVAKKEMRQVRETAAAAETTWQASRQNLRRQQEKGDHLRRRIHRLQEQTAATQEHRDEVRDRLEQARRDVAILQERHRTIVQRQAEIEAELPVLEQQFAVATTELTAATADLESAQQNLAQNQAQLHQFKVQFQTQQTEITRWQNEQRQAETEQRATQTRLAQAQGQLNQLREQLQGVSGEQEEAGELAQMAAAFEELTAVAALAQEKVDALDQKRRQTQNKRLELIHELKQLRRAHDEDEEERHRNQTQLARLEARQDILDQLRLKEVDAGDDVRVIGHLATLITIPDDYRIAVAAALSARLATIILPDASHLWRLLAGQGGNLSGGNLSGGNLSGGNLSGENLSAVALDDVQPQPTPETPDDTAVIGWASDIVSCRPEVQTAVHLLLGHVLLVRDARAAYRLAKTLPFGAMAVTPEGFVAHAGGLVEQSGREAQNNILASEEAWRKGKDDVQKMKDEVAMLTQHVDEQHDTIQEKQNQADALQAEEQRLNQSLNEARQQLSQAQQDVAHHRQQQSFLTRQQEARQQEANRLEARIRALELQMTADQNALSQLETAVNTAQVNLAALPVAEAQQQQDNLQQATDATQTIVAGRQAVVDSRRATLNQFEQQFKRHQEQLSALQEQQAQLSLQEKEQERQSYHDQLADLEASLAPLQERLKEARIELAQLEEETAVAQKETHDHETILTQAKIAFSQQKNEIEGLQERIKVDLGIVALHYDEDQTGPTPLPISGVQALPVVTELPEDIEETIQNHRAQMQRMGAINPDAPQEYDETEARYDFLVQQIDDLNQTEAQLRQIIDELDELTSRAFAETVDKVNNVFRHTFTQLFGGGTGRLVLTDPDDLTISGVDIVARLPNRREQGLGLLSGGERSLTAAALIFSLLKVSPTPFCVMDEVDAALDEANINRFRELLRELSLETQFIVITHNRGTIQAAQTVYGISMGSDSVSQAISIRPEDYVKQPELI